MSAKSKPAAATTATTAVSALEELEVVRAGVLEAEQHVEKMRAQASAAGRRVAAARAPLQAYFRRVGAREIEADPAEEAKLRAVILKASAGTSVQPVAGSNEVRVIDDMSEHLVSGALDALEDAKAAVPRFISDERDRLQHELTEHAVTARDELLAAIEAFDAAASRWSNVQVQWKNYGPSWGIQIGGVPANFAAGATEDVHRALSPQAGPMRRDPRRLIPMPPQLVPTDIVAPEDYGTPAEETDEQQFLREQRAELNRWDRGRSDLPDTSPVGWG